MGLEIERKFLLPSVPVSLPQYPSAQIRQFYTNVDPATDTYTRYRKEFTHETTKHTRTRKRGHGLGRPEDECTVTFGQYEYFLRRKRYAGSIVQKERFRVPLDDGTVCFIDVFAGPLHGLVIAEIEFDTLEAAHAFTPPEWFGREVTGDRRFGNLRLALEGLPIAPAIIRQFERQRIWATQHSRDMPYSLVMGTLWKAVADSTVDRPHIVGIAGGSASGKTTFVTQRFLRQFPEAHCVVPMDDYFRGATWMAAHPHCTWDDPEAIDLDRLAQDLERLRRGETVRKPVYDFTTGEPGGEETVVPKPIIVVDGLFTLRPPILELLDLRLFVRASGIGRLVRRLVRDVDRTGQSEGAILKQFTETVLPKHEQYVAVSEQFADIVFDNDLDPTVELERVGLAYPQFKFRGTLDDRVRRRIRAEWLCTVQQRDRYLTAPDRDLGAMDALLRLRCENGRWTLAFKGPRSAGPGVRRPVLTAPLEDDTVDVVQRWFPPGHLEICKERTLYQFTEGTIACDSVSLVDGNGVVRPLGHFTEVRWAREHVLDHEVQNLVAALDLDPSARIDLPYAQLAAGVVV